MGSLRIYFYSRVDDNGVVMHHDYDRYSFSRSSEVNIGNGNLGVAVSSSRSTIALVTRMSHALEWCNALGVSNRSDSLGLQLPMAIARSNRRVFLFSRAQRAYILNARVARVSCKLVYKQNSFLNALNVAWCNFDSTPPQSHSKRLKIAPRPVLGVLKRIAALNSTRIAAFIDFERFLSFCPSPLLLD